MPGNAEGGYTLVELLVVITIIGVLALVAVPSYLKSIETSRADDAVAVSNMLAAANRMFYLDHVSTYTTGTLSTTATGCNAGDSCPTSGPYTACALVACKYLAAQDWTSKHYTFATADGTAGGCQSMSGSYVACAKRKTSGTNSTSISPYNTWAYGVQSNGVIATEGTSTPTPVQ